MPTDPSTGLPAQGATHLARPALRRVLVYGVVGLAVSLFYSLAVIACVLLLEDLNPTLSSVLAFAITLPVAYLAHSKVSFADSRNDRFQPLRFAVSTASSFIAAVGGMYVITEIAGQSYLLGIAWNWLVIPAINLTSYMVWVFRTGWEPRKGP